MKKLGWLSMCLFLLLFKPAFTQAATETETEMVQITFRKQMKNQFFSIKTTKKCLENRT